MTTGTGPHWWTTAFIEAIEGTATTDASRIRKGRSTANAGRVRALELSEGFARADVEGEKGQTYVPDLSVRTLSPSEWDEVIDVFGDRSAAVGALLAGTLDRQSADALAGLDIDLIPRPSDIRTDCSCGDWAQPCAHAAALGFAIAEDIDRDPIRLLTLRGMPREDLLGRLRAARVTGDHHSAEDRDPTTPDPWEAQPLDAGLAPLPDVVAELGTVHAPGRHTMLRSSSDEPLDTVALGALADDAILRAWLMLVDGSSSGLDAGSKADLARRAAQSERADAISSISHKVAVASAQLSSWVAAWRSGGAHAVEMLTNSSDTWSTDPERLSDARDTLIRMGFPPRSLAMNYDSIRMDRTVWLVPGVDGRWYRLEGNQKNVDLQLCGAPALDVGELVDPPPN